MKDQNNKRRMVQRRRRGLNISSVFVSKTGYRIPRVPSRCALRETGLENLVLILGTPGGKERTSLTRKKKEKKNAVFPLTPLHLTGCPSRFSCSPIPSS